MGVQFTPIANCAWPDRRARAPSLARSTASPPSSTIAPALVAGALSSDPAKAKHRPGLRHSSERPTAPTRR